MIGFAGAACSHKGADWIRGHGPLLRGLIQVEVVLCHLLTQAALFKHVIDHATLGEIGFCCFYRCIFFDFFAVFSNKIVIYF